MSGEDVKPVHIVEDQDTGDRFLVFGTDKGMRLDIRYEGETLWMTQAQIAELFGRDQSVISRHIKSIFEEDQLDMGRLVVMDDAKRLLDQQLASLGRTVLKSGGRVKSDAAKRAAHHEYKKYNEARKIVRQQEADKKIATLAAEAKKLPRTKRT